MGQRRRWKPPGLSASEGDAHDARACGLVTRLIDSAEAIRHLPALVGNDSWGRKDGRKPREMKPNPAKIMHQKQDFG